MNKYVKLEECEACGADDVLGLKDVEEGGQAEPKSIYRLCYCTNAGSRLAFYPQFLSDDATITVRTILQVGNFLLKVIEKRNK